MRLLQFYHAYGDSLWVKRYDASGVNVDAGRSVKIDNLYNVYITGYRYINDSIQFVTIKYDTNGLQKWLMSYPVEGFYLNLDKFNNVYVLGNNSVYGTGSDFILIKYSQLTNINSNTNEIPIQTKLFQNYPNPFNPITTIKYSLPTNEQVTIKIYDILGRLVTTLVNEFKKAGYYDVKFDGTNYASGVYFYRIDAGKYADSKKMILVK